MDRISGRKAKAGRRFARPARRYLSAGGGAEELAPELLPPLLLPPLALDCDGAADST